MRLLSILLVFSLFSTVESTPTSDSFIENSLTFARFVNGLYLGQNYDELDKKGLIRELFPIGPNVTLDELRSFNFDQLAKDFGSIRNVVGSECKGNEGCGVSKEVLDGMRAMETLKAHVQTLENALKMSRTNGFLDIDKLESKLLSIIITQDQNLKDVILDSLGQLDSTTTLKEAYVIFAKCIPALKQLAEMDWNETLYQNFDASLTSVRNDLTPIRLMESASQSLNAQSNSVKALKNQLKSLETKFQKLTTSINSKFLGIVFSSMDSLVNFNPFIHNERKMSAGFSDGLDDIKTAVKDDDNAFLKNFLNSGNKLDAVSSDLKSLGRLIPLLTPLDSSHKKVKVESDGEVWKMEASIEEGVQTITDLSDLVSSYSKCVQPLDLSLSFDGEVSKLLKNLDNTKNEVKSGMEKVNEFFTNHNGSFAAFNKLRDKLNSLKRDKFKLYDFIEKDPLINETIISLNQFDADFKALELKSLEAFFSQLQITSLNIALNKWNEDTGFIMAMDCLKNEDYIGKIQKLNPSVEPLSNLNVEPIRNLDNSIKKLSKTWKKIKPTLKSESKSSNSNFKNAKIISKHLGDISSIAYRLFKMQEKRSDILTVIENKKKISTAIYSIQDMKLRLQLYFMWTTSNTDAIYENLYTAQSMLDKVEAKGEVKNISDFTEAFKEAAKVEPCTFDFRKLALVAKLKKLDKEIVESLESVKDLDVMFVKFDESKIEPMIAELEKYFDLVFPCIRYYCPPKRFPYEIIAIIFSFVFGIIVFYPWFKEKFKCPCEKSEDRR